MPFHFEVITPSYYQALVQYRIPAEALEEQQLMHLLISCSSGLGAQAVRAAVYVDKLRETPRSTTCNVLYTDEDLHVVNRGHPSKIEKDFWLPDIALPIKTAHIHAAGDIGYFLPYESGYEIELARLQRIAPPTETPPEY